MKLKNITKVFVILGFVGLQPISAVKAATVTTFTSSASFFSSLGSIPIITETYEGIPLNTVIAPGTTVDGITYNSFNGDSTLLGGRIDNTFNKIGTQSLAANRTGTPTGFFFAGDSFSITLPNPTRAIGIFFNANLTNTSTDLFINTPVGNATTGGPSYDFSTFYFAGLISDTPFTTATIGDVAGSSSFNVDNLTYSVPEPANALGTLAFGTLTVGYLLKRKSRKVA